MPEEKNVSLYQQQKLTKPLAEDIVPEYLVGGMAESAIQFAAWLRANKMKPAWVLTNQWRAVYKGRGICRITLTQPQIKDPQWQWIVTAYLERLNDYEEIVVSENLQRFLWDNVYYCVQKPKDSPPAEEFRHYALKWPCNIWGCAPGKNITVCGKELTNICRNGNRQFFWCHDPDDETITALKRLLELEKKARENK